MKTAVANFIAKRKNGTLSLTFGAWATHTNTTKEKVADLFRVVRKGWTKVGMKRWKDGPNVVAGLALLNASKSFERNLALCRGFHAFKRHARFDKGAKALLLMLYGWVTNRAFKRWEEETDSSLVEVEKAKIGLRRWSRFVLRRDSAHAAYAEQRRKKSALIRWNRSVSTLRREKARRIDVERRVDDHLEGKRLETLGRGLDCFVKFVSRELKAMDNLALGDDHFEVVRMSSAVLIWKRNAAKAKSRRDKTITAREFRRLRLLRTAFVSIKLSFAGQHQVDTDAVVVEGTLRAEDLI